MRQAEHRYLKILFPLLLFWSMVIPIFFNCGFTQDEVNLLHRKCLVAEFKGEPIFSDDWCSSNNLTRRKNYYFFETVVQPLPPQYSVEIKGIRIPLNSWFHTSGLIYSLQDIMLYLAEKIDKNNFLLKMVLIKVPGLIFSSFTLIGLYRLSEIIGVSPLMVTIFTSTLGIFIFAGGIGISIIYTFTFLILTLSLIAFFKRNSLLFLLLTLIGVYSYIPSTIFFVTIAISGFLMHHVNIRFLILVGTVISISFFPYILTILDTGIGEHEIRIFDGLFQSNLLTIFLITKKVNQTIMEICDENIFCFLFAKIIVFLSDFLSFFAFYGAGNGLIVEYNPPSDPLFYLPFIPYALILFTIYSSLFRKMNREQKTLAISFLIFSFFQIFAFPFGENPRRMGLILPVLSLLASIPFKIESSRKRLYIFSLILSLHFIGQFFIYHNMLVKLFDEGRFDFCVHSKIQKELVQKIQNEGEDKFVNISGVVNFPILLGNSSKIPDYGYYFGYVRSKIKLTHDSSDAKQKLKDIISYHRNKKFIFQSSDKDFIFSSEIFSLGIKIFAIPEEGNPVYYIVEIEE